MCMQAYLKTITTAMKRIGTLRLQSCLWLIGCLLLPVNDIQSQTLTRDTLVNLLHDEAQFYLDKLKEKEIPAYFISLRVVDQKQLFLSSDFGLYSVDRRHTRTLTPQVRVGSPACDNFAYLAQNNPRVITPLPLECDDAYAIKNAVWEGIKKQYETAVNTYQQIVSSQKTNVTELDSVPTFAPAPVERHYEQPLDEAATRIDPEEYRKYLCEASRLFRRYKLTTGKVALNYSIQRTTFVNTEGTVIAQNRQAYLLYLEAVAKAADGTNCRLFENIFTYSEDSLPSPAILAERVQRLAERAEALSNAPMAEAYTGPALLSGSAGAVLFHEVLGHRLEGKRRESVNNEISGLLNHRLLPASFQLYLDPTLKTYSGQALNGHYLYDDEGVRGQRVDCVKDGVLRQYLMGRTPVREFSGSNGHGRAAEGFAPNPRQSNLIVETTDPHTGKELREQFIGELRRQGKEYGYYFHTVEGGFTSRGNPNAVNVFNVRPVEVYRVYTDGRPDQLVRGVSLIGTPLSVFSHIKAAGDRSELFTGFCGSESGTIPVAGVSPMIYVSQVETQGRKAILQEKEDLISAPDTTTSAAGHLADSPLIFQAMEDEMSHICRELHDKHNVRPLFVNYAMKRQHISSVKSSGGVCIEKSETGPKNHVAAHILLGDTMLTNDIRNQNARLLPDELDYHTLRTALREMTEEAYKDAIFNLDKKRQDLKQKPKPAADAAIPEFQTMPPATWIGPSALTGRCRPEDMEALSNRLSKVFLEYPELFNHQVYMEERRVDYYRLTSEGQKILQPDTLLSLSARASCRDTKGRIETEYYRLRAGSLGDLPPEEELLKELHQFARHIQAKSRAASVEDLYIGPVLYVDDAAQSLLVGKITEHAHSNWVWYQNRFDLKHRYLGKMAFPALLSVYQLGNDSAYNGVKLLGYRQVDADGRPPQSLPVIVNGVLKNMLTGRKPTIGRVTSTGNEHFYELNDNLATQYGAGIFHVTASRTMPYAKLYKCFLKSARKAGLKYAYVIRGTRATPYKLIRVDLATGKEELVKGRYYNPSREQFRRIAGVSKEENVYNLAPTYGGGDGIIAPKAILLEDMELNIEPPNTTYTDPYFYQLRH